MKTVPAFIKNRQDLSGLLYEILWEPHREAWPTGFRWSISILGQRTFAWTTCSWCCGTDRAKVESSSNKGAKLIRSYCLATLQLSMDPSEDQPPILEATQHYNASGARWRIL